MYGIIATNLTYIFKFRLCNRLFIRNNSSAFQNSFCKFLFLYRNQHLGNLLFIFWVRCKLKFSVKKKKNKKTVFFFFFLFSLYFSFSSSTHLLTSLTEQPSFSTINLTGTASPEANIIASIIFVKLFT